MNKLNLALDRVKENWFGVITDPQNQLVASAFGPNKKLLEKYLTEYARGNSGQQLSRDEHPFTECMAELFYDRKPSSSVKFNTEHISPFQGRVTKILRFIPKHKVTTYGLIARKIGSGPRAVGNAVASNSCPLFVPDHRVVSSTLSIGNYTMCGTLDNRGSLIKRQLLEREEVPIKGDKISPTGIWDPFGE